MSFSEYYAAISGDKSNAWKDEPVEVTLSGLSAIGEQSLYVVDAEKGVATEVGEGSTVMVTPNDYGRYFLTRGSVEDMGKQSGANAILVSVNGDMVSIAADGDLGTVRALTVGGSVAYQSDDVGHAVRFSLTRGVYLIQIDGAAGRQSVKVVVR